MLEKDLLQDVLRTALSRGGDFADIYLEQRRVTGVGFEDDRIERVQSGLDAGAGIRVVAGEATAYAYTNQLDRRGFLDAAEVVARAAAGGNGKDVSIDLRRLAPTVSFDIEKMPDEIPTAEKVDRVERANRAARAVDGEKIKQVIVGYGDVVQQVTIANSDGTLVEDERVRTRLVVHAIAAAGDIIQTGYEALGGVKGFELLDGGQPEEIARRAARRACDLLEAQPAPSGRMAVVLSGEAGGTMVHEACGHGLEADLVQKGVSVYAGKRGETVASPAVSVIDDATLPGRYGSYTFDDEGVPARKVTLIENGVLIDYLYDTLTARKDGRASNGHGRRESYQYKPIPRMGNTFIAPGKDDPEGIIREVRDGLLVRKMGGGQVNTTTGDFVFEVAEGYLIEDGQIGPLVRGATLAGNGPEVLRKVDRVGRDLGFTIGTCGKDGQGVPVSDAQPTLLLGQRPGDDPPIVVGGTGKARMNKKAPRIIRL
ncbi:MAG: TldD/PmbA family protein [Bacillota bacterium]|nr:TldD/PmbA family protein [Bacillota bacterium]